jgi:hypothetical protein
MAATLRGDDARNNTQTSRLRNFFVLRDENPAVAPMLLVVMAGRRDSRASTEFRFRFEHL